FAKSRQTRIVLDPFQQPAEEVPVACRERTEENRLAVMACIGDIPRRRTFDQSPCPPARA
ncbi:MAG TPA: hypothetical protein VG345_04155, partial [Bryobacteraceae bacterium]|nr:hypothetical protein [Bryobacteraceae bacterium]